MNTFNVIAGIASIAGLAITIWTFVRVGRIEKGFTRQALLPLYRRKLAAFVKNLKTHEKDKNFAEIRSILVVCRAVLNDLIPFVRDQRKERTMLAIGIIEEALGQSDDCLWNQSSVIIAELQGLAETIDNLMNELKWRGRDGG